MDIFQGGTAETDSGRNIAQTALHQNDISRVDRNVCSGTDRDSDICAGEGRSIVDTVADHGDFALFFERTDHAFLAVRENACDNIVHTCLSTDRSCGTLIVTGQHDNTDSHILEFFDRLRAVFFDDVSDGDDADQLAIAGKKEGSFSFFCKLFCLLGECGRNAYLAADKFHASTDQSFIIKHSRKSISRKGVEICDFRCCEMKTFGVAKDRFGERMLALFFQGKCHGEEFLFGNSICREQICHFRLTTGDCTGFVQGNDLDFACFFKRNSGFEQDTVLGTHSVADHDRYRSGKSERAWTTDNENGNSAGKCIAEFMSGQKPDKCGENRNRDDCRHKDTGNTVCDLGDRSLGSCCVTHHFDDLGEGGILADAGCFAFDKSRLVDSSGRDKISGGLVDRDTFACKGRFIDSTGSLDDHTVNRDVFSWADHKDVSLVDLLDRNGSFLTVAENDSGLWREFHEALESVSGFSLGTGFKHFANSDQSQDHCRGFEVKIHHVVHDSGRIAVDLSSCHGEECVDTPYKRCHGTEGNECIHVRGTMPQALESADEKFLVDDHDDSGKQKLYKTHCDMVVIKPCRQRPAPHHMSHGEVHQHEQKSDGSDQTMLEDRCLVILEGFFGFRYGNLFPIGSLEGCAVTCLFYGIDNIMGGSRSFHTHGVRQKADRAGCDSRYLGYSLLHTGAAGSATHTGDVVLFHCVPPLMKCSGM